MIGAIDCTVRAQWMGTYSAGPFMSASSLGGTIPTDYNEPVKASINIGSHA